VYSPFFGLACLSNRSLARGSLPNLRNEPGRAILKSTHRRGSISLLDSNTKDVRWRVGPFASGVLTSLSNPYWLVWWATVGSAYLVFSAQYGLIGVLIFYVGHILSDISWYCFVAYALAHGRSVINDKVYNRILGVCGVFLLLLGVYFLYYGLTTLF